MPYCHLYVIALVYVLYKFIKLWQNKDVIVINTLLSLLFRRKRIPYFFTLLLISLQLFWGEEEGGGISRFPHVPTCTSFFLRDLNHATLENESPRKWNLHGIRCNCMMVLSSNKKKIILCLNLFCFLFLSLLLLHDEHKHFSASQRKPHSHTRWAYTFNFALWLMKRNSFGCTFFRAP